MQELANSTEYVTIDNNNIISNENRKKYMVGGKFDTVSFNKDFGIILKKQITTAEDIEKSNLNKYNEYYNEMELENERKKKYENTINNLSLLQILDKWNYNLKNIISDIITDDFSINIFLKDDRLIYIGMTFILIGMIGYIINQYLLN